MRSYAVFIFLRTSSTCDTESAFHLWGQCLVNVHTHEHTASPYFKFWAVLFSRESDMCDKWCYTLSCCWVVATSCSSSQPWPQGKWLTLRCAVWENKDIPQAKCLKCLFHVQDFQLTVLGHFPTVSLEASVYVYLHLHLYQCLCPYPRPCPCHCLCICVYIIWVYMHPVFDRDFPQVDKEGAYTLNLCTLSGNRRAPEVSPGPGAPSNLLL
jgi:hypothetical protein